MIFDYNTETSGYSLNNNYVIDREWIDHTVQDAAPLCTEKRIVFLILSKIPIVYKTWV